MGVYDDLVKQAKELAEQNKVPEGYIWISILIKYDLNGKTEIVRSFAKPAENSKIKSILKFKPKKQKINIEEDEESGESLFG